MDPFVPRVSFPAGTQKDTRRRLWSSPAAVPRGIVATDTVWFVSSIPTVPATSPLPLGFRWSAATAGLKSSGKPDVALALCDGGANAAAMFTSNQLQAAPVLIGKRHLRATSGRVSAILVNAGNANCATGEPGLAACQRSCIAVAEQFGCVFDEVLPCSTGIIGVPLPVDKLIGSIPQAKAALGNTAAHAEAFAAAILTTDTKVKTARASFDLDGRTVKLFGCAKGAGMIGPQVVPAQQAQAQAPHATMLVYLFTDLDATAGQLADMLQPAVESSFNCISIDGDMSTNDTVLLAASGQSGVRATGPALAAFASALRLVCESLAYKIVDDGEGVTHVITLEITGTPSDRDARTLARTIAGSPLCKTAWSSGDPNWGRLLAAAGRAGVPFDPVAVTVHIAGLPVFAYGVRSPEFDEAAVHEAMSTRGYAITMNFGGGNGQTKFITCDLTHEYVSINADYST